jgi:mono/diheme cytochrome c family protein
MGVSFTAARRQALVLAIAVAILALANAQAVAQRSFPGPKQFPEQGGEAIFNGVCRDCHMSGGRGAIGAGAYPALANNKKLAEPGYPLAVIIGGQKAMPEFGPLFSDQQIADVVNYIRTHFGNNYKDKVSPADVKAARS